MLKHLSGSALLALAIAAVPAGGQIAPPTTTPMGSQPAAAVEGTPTLALIGLTGDTLLLPSSMQAMTHQTATLENPRTHTTDTYSGVPLLTLLVQLGAPSGQDVHGKTLSAYVVATGSDGYKAVLALAEIEPDFHPGQVIVADSMNGKPLDVKEGPYRLIVTEDKHPARCVHNLVKLELKQAP